MTLYYASWSLPRILFSSLDLIQAADNCCNCDKPSSSFTHLKIKLNVDKKTE